MMNRTTLRLVILLLIAFSLLGCSLISSVVTPSVNPTATLPPVLQMVGTIQAMTEAATPPTQVPNY